MANQNFRFAKQLRLLSPADYKAVFDKNQFKASNASFLVLAKPNGESCPRLGLVVAKRHIKTAVQRNRIKRNLRETFRTHQSELAGLDIVVLVRSGADTMPNAEIQQQVLKLWHKVLRKQQNSRKATG